MRPSGDRIAAVLAILLAGVLIFAFRHREPERIGDFGYDPDPAGAKLYAQSLPAPTFSEAAPDVMRKTKPQDTFLFRAMDAAHRARYGTPFSVSNQGSVGSCVAHGAAHAIYASEAVSWSLGERSEPPLLVSQPSIYGGSRVEIRGKSINNGGDGSTGFHAAKWLSEYGVIYQKPYDSFDCTDNSPALCKLWGRYGNGGEGNTALDEDAKKTPARHVTRIRNWDELVAAVCNGYAVTIASSQGFAKTTDDECFLRPSGTWMHQMAIVGVKVEGRQGACIMNSWGGNWITYRGERWPSDLPKGCFWADRSVVERILSQGDSWAIAEIAFVYRPVNHANWLQQ